jgi:hypothetical protein
MERHYGRWLVYLRFDDSEKTSVFHVLCDEQVQLERIIATAKQLAGDSVLTEHAVWSSQQNIYTREAEGLPERYVLTYDAFMAAFGGLQDESSRSA